MCGWRKKDVLVLGGVGAFLLAAYAGTHAYPARLGGFYLELATELVDHSFLAPRYVTDYAVEQIPFAYPPIGPYLMAVPIALGVAELTVLTYLPGLCFILAAMAVYAFVTEHLDDRRYGLAAGVLTLASPQILWESIVGAGVPRSLGLLWFALGLLAVERAFDADSVDWRQVAVAGVLFGLCLLTHYIYTLLFVLATLLVFVRSRPTSEGFTRGLAIAAVGLAVASPWLLTVALKNDVATLLTPSSTNRGGLAPVPRLLLFKLVGQTASPIGYLSVLGGIVGSVFLIVRQRVLLPALTAVYAVIMPHPPSLYALFAMLSAVALVDVVDLAKSQATVSPRRAQTIARGFFVVLLAGAVIFGGIYVADVDTTVGSPSTPLDADSAAAMAWASEETATDATFLIGTEVAEWFPAIADRRIAVTRWGFEWLPADARQYHLGTYEKVRACGDAACFATITTGMRAQPTYLVVDQDRRATRSLDRSPQFELAYDGPRLQVFAVQTDHPADVEE